MDQVTPSKGFSLLELLIVIAIIGVLVAIALPSYRAINVQAYTKITQLTLLDLHMQQQHYHLVHGKYAPIDELKVPLLKYHQVSMSNEGNSDFEFVATLKEGVFTEYQCTVVKLDHLLNKTPQGCW